MKPMIVWTCEKHKKKKCKSDQPCVIMFPADGEFTRGCPMWKKSKWITLPTTELTV
ncbi:MAG: hypothetical protein MUO73_01970 [Thermoplasmata archaeon]|nr:hypothetical protein [Thermoplasmata archaeon]